MNKQEDNVEVVELVDIELISPHPMNGEIYSQQYDNIDKLLKSIKTHGQLEPIVLNSQNIIISGHRRFKVLQLLGFKVVKVRYQDFDNEIESLINFNVQREKRGNDIQNEIQYLEREVYNRTQKGSKRVQGKKVDKLTDYANRYDISRKSASVLIRIHKECPKLIPRIKLKGNLDGDITINHAWEICSKNKGLQGVKKTNKDVSTLKGVIPRIEKDDLLEVLQSTYPYSMMGSYSSHNNSHTIELNDKKFERLSTKRDELISNLDFLSSLDSREVLLWNKVDEVHNLSVPKKVREEVFKNLWKPTDIYNEEKTIGEIKQLQPILVRVKANDEFNSLRVLTHSLHWNQNIGRNLKYIVKDKGSGMYLGIITIGSDVILIQSRDEKIGWTDYNKFNQRKLGNIGIASTICPTQPLGFNFLGTKLVASLTTLQQIRDDWEDTYGDKLVGLTTTSLFGSKSSYNGIKWWKKMGTSSGKLLITPSKEHYEFWHTWVKENHPSFYEKIVKDGETLVSGPKQKTISLIYRLLGIPTQNYYHGYQRGVYFSPFYENTYQFLRGEIGEEELEPHSNGVGDYDKIMEWWKVRAINRYKKLLTDGRLDNKPVWFDTINKEDVVEWLELRGKHPLIEDE